MHLQTVARVWLIAMLATAVPLAARAEDTTTVPITVINGHAFVSARINGHGPYSFALDTGAGDMIASDTARTIGLHPSGSFRIYGTGEDAERGSSAKVATIAIGTATLENTTFTVAPLERIRAAEGTPFDGLLGHELFARFVATIDYANRTLTLASPALFHAPADATTLPLRSNGGIPVVAGSIDGIAGDFTLDTGDRGSLTLMSPFVARNRLRERYRPVAVGIVGMGFGGPVRAAVARIGTFTFAGFSLDGIAARFPTLRDGYFTSTRVAGNIGAGILSRFLVTIDVPDKKLVLSRADGYDLPDRFDRSGMWLMQTESGLRVGDLTPGGPAAKAAITVGDRIVSVDGRRSQTLSLPDLRAQLADPAESAVTIVLDHHGTTRTVVLALADLV